MKKLFFLVPLITLLFACQPGDDKLAVSGENYIFDTIVNVYEADFTEAWAGGQDLLSDDNSSWLQYSFCASGTLLFRNVESDSVIKMTMHNPDCTEIQATMHKDGIYVVTGRNNLIYYPNGSSEPVVLYNLNEIPVFANSGMTVEWHKPGSDQKYNIPKNTVYFRVNQDYDSLNGNYSKYTSGYPISAKLNFKTEKLEFFGKAPQYAARHEYGLLSQVFDLYKGGEIIYTNQLDGTITVINTVNGKEKKLDRPSRYQEKPVSKFLPGTKNKQQARQEKWEHRLFSASYEALFYNPSDKHYYRLFHPEMSKLRDNGLRNTESDKRAVLMIFDSKLNLEDEVVLPVNGSHFVKIFPLKDGVALSLQGSLKQEGKYIRIPIFRIRKRTDK